MKQMLDTNKESLTIKQSLKVHLLQDQSPPIKLVSRDKLVKQENTMTLLMVMSNISKMPKQINSLPLRALLTETLSN